MPTPVQILEKYWGYTAFRDQQEAVVESILQKKDTLAILPTGAGKSVCYQVPALLLEGNCIVVSPLIALMKDQVMQLLKRKITALVIHSGMAKWEVEETYKKFSTGAYKFLFVSPERLQSALFIDYIADWQIALLVVDEAHCISQWGYDFRVAYLQIASIKEYLPHVPILALTASATIPVQNDIVEKLQLQNPTLIRSSIARKNVSLHVVETENKQNKIVEIIQKVQGSALVYCRNRSTTIKLCEMLQQQGIGSVAYHGGMDMHERNKAQEAWINNEQKVAVCTNAFGMGIDKPDVRLVIHIDMPDSPEAYYQEAGRAGRDGQKSYAILLKRTGEQINITERVAQHFPYVAQIKEVYNSICNYLHVAPNTGENDMLEFDIVDFCKQTNTNNILAHACIKILEQQSFWKATEGYYIPASLQVLAKKNDVEFIEKNYPVLDNVLKAILRLYSGIFYNYVKIQTAQIAKHAELDISIVVNSILQLQQLGILHYLPAKDKAQLIFLQDRFFDYDFTINTTLLSFLRERFENRLQAMANYISTKNICRMQQLATYFHEEKIEPCTKCDVCIAKNKKIINEQLFNTLRNKIVENLQEQKTLTLSAMMQNHSTDQQQKLEEVIKYMLENNQIKINAIGEIQLYNEQ